MTNHDRTAGMQGRMLGAELRRLRTAAGLTQEQAATHIGKAPNKVSRVETGAVGIDKTDLDALLSLYGTSEKDGLWVRHLADGAWRRRGRPGGEAAAYRGPRWFRSFHELEQDAVEVRRVGSEVITGILQTEGYTRAMFAAQGVDPEAEIVRETVRLRAERRKLLTKEGAATFDFIVSESALRRRIGDEDTMREQVEHVIDLIYRPNITVQVMPFESKTYEPMGYDFTVLHFADVDDCVYIEMYDDATYLDREESVRTYTDLFARLQKAALTPDETRDFLAELVK